MNNKCHAIELIRSSDDFIFTLSKLDKVGFFPNAKEQVCGRIFTTEESEAALEYLGNAICLNKIPHIEHSDGNHYCLFHLPTFEKDGEQFSTSFRERCDNIGYEPDNFLRSNNYNINSPRANILRFDFRHYWFPEAVDFTSKMFQGDIDFSSAVFKETVNFERCVFDGEVKFDRAVFNKRLNATSAKFKDVASFKFAKVIGDVSFEKASFEKTTEFDDVIFESNFVSFKDSVFSETVGFERVTFPKNVSFENVKFSNNAYFTEIEVFGFDKNDKSGINLRNTKFGKDVYFTGSKFRRNLDFQNIEFGGNINFKDSIFDCEFDISKLTFQGEMDFTNAIFEKTAKFEGTNFQNNVGFSDATFSDEAYFHDTKFFGTAAFSSTEFKGNVDFSNAQFYKLVFFGSVFMGVTTFSRTVFHDEAYFGNSPVCENYFIGDLTLNCIFKKKADFESSFFDSEKIIVGNTHFAFPADIPEMLKKFMTNKIKVDLIIHNAGQLVTCAGNGKAKKGNAMQELGIIENGAVAVVGNLIKAVGTSDEILSQYESENVLDASGKVVMPAFVDPHTHIIYGGNRLDEFELKIKGADYLEILANGGGILSTVKHTREASKQELVESTLKRLDKMLAHGTATVEIKTGYGLDQTTEFKMLGAWEELDKIHPIYSVPTFLAAHAVPPEFKENPNEYVRIICEQMIPDLFKWRRYGYIDEDRMDFSEKMEKPFFVDVFCEKNAFDLEQTKIILETARANYFGIKAHVDEFTNLGGSKLCIELGATSIDHLDTISDGEIALLANSDTIGIITPTVNFNFGSTEFADARKLIDAGCAIAVSTDYNPGSAPCPSQQTAMQIACRYQKILPSEAIIATTINSAFSIGLGEKTGSLEAGKWADITILDSDDYREVCYEFGCNFVKKVIKSGKVILEN